MKKDDKEIEKRDNKILISIIAIIAIIFLIFSFKDTVLEKVDFMVRKKTMLKAYNERVILKDKNNEGYIHHRDFDVKLDNLKVENNELSFDLLFNKDFSKIAKGENLSIAYGVKITDKNNKLIVYKHNMLLPEIANQNKCNIFKARQNEKRSINPYSYMYQKENNLDNFPEEFDLTVNKNITFEKLVKENDLYKAHFSFKLKENVNKEDLTISFHEIMILKEHSKLLLYNFEHFTEWVF